MIQAHIRRCIAIKRFQEVWVYYNWAILEIQRHIRGALGRSLALKKLTALVEKEHAKNMNEKRKLEMTRGERAIIKLQSFFRKEKATSKVQELREQNRRERNIRHAMENQREAFRRERKVYERQLEQFYVSLKEENDMKGKKELKIAHDQIKVRTLRRRIKNDELKNAEPDNSEQLLTDEWKKNWELKIQNGVESIKEYSIHCLESPDNRREKKTGALVRKRIRGRVSQVILRADSRGILMETPEAKEIAKDEIVFIIGEEERARLRSEMDKAFFQRKQEKEEAAHKARMKKRTETARSEVHAVNVVGKACRKWLARKELRRLCLEKFEKIYDDTEHTFYYINKETGDTFWSKPKAMGMFEIPTKYEWKLLRDAHDFPYYFNPCSMEMRWNPPPQEETCCGTVPHTWWREYPVQLGKCPNFASLLNENDGKRYCSGCYCASRVEPKF